MILGRTDKGAIKIKSDGPLGLRAVNCACCGSCGCGIQVPQNLRTLVEGGNFTMYGVSPEDLTFEDDYWYAEFFLGLDDGFYCAGIRYFFETGCIGKFFLFIEFRNGDECNDNPCSGYGQFGTPEGCGEPAGGVGTFTINGQGAYPYYWFGDVEVPPPNLVFS